MWPVYNEKGEVELIISSFTAKNDGNNLDYFVGRFNYTTKTWKYKNIPIRGFSRGLILDLDENAFYVAAGTGLTRYNLETGAQGWSTTNRHGYSTEGIVMHNDLIIGVLQDPEIVAVDKKTGFVKWRDVSGSTCSQLEILNGVLYYTSAGRGLLYAREPETGKVLWEINQDFDTEFVVIPPMGGAKGKIIASSFSKAYCYEAIE